MFRFHTRHLQIHGAYEFLHAWKISFILLLGLVPQLEFIDEPTLNFHSSQPGVTNTDKKQQRPACLCLSQPKPSNGHQWNSRWSNLLGKKSRLLYYSTKYLLIVCNVLSFVTKIYVVTFVNNAIYWSGKPTQNNC